MPDKKQLPIICLLAICLFATACHVVRAIAYLGPDTSDKNHLPTAIIPKSPQPFHFAFRENGISKPKLEYLATKLHNTNTDAFIVIQNDTIVYEYFSKKHDRSSLFLGFSLSKSFVGTMLGIAIDEGYIKHTGEKIVTYIPEFRSAEESLQNVTIQQLLDMRAGIMVDERSVGLNTTMTRMYYGRSINRELFKLKSADSNRFEYKNTNTQLLLLIIERATGQKFLDYFRDKLWHKIGAEYDAQWVIDDHKHQTPKAFFGMIASAYDYAKLGRLYINNGELNMQTIVSKDWVSQCCNMDTLFKYRYKNHFWANNFDNYFKSDSMARAFLGMNNLSAPIQCFNKNSYCVSLKGNSFIAEGLLDQYIYINPEKNLIIVRMGEEVQRAGPAMDEVITTLGNAF